MLGWCAQAANVLFRPEHGCTCMPGHTYDDAAVRRRLRRGTCQFLQFPNSPGLWGGPFKDLPRLLRNLSTRPPAIVHQLDRLV